VISGTFRIGMGENADPSKASAMPAGSFIALAPGTLHFVSVDEETVVQLNNIDPWVITYIDPKDDPRPEPKQHAPLTWSSRRWIQRCEPIRHERDLQVLSQLRSWRAHVIGRPKP
jgi:hypothetical protein